MNISLLDSLRNRFWPVKKSETTKVLLICIFKGLISSIYCILSNLKDAIVIGPHKSGAEVIPVLKGFVVLPISILFIIIYSRLRNKYSGSNVFYGIMIFFILSILFYAFILLPNESILRPSKSASKLLEFVGQNNKHWVAVYLNWPRAFFFMITELWTQATIFILFWEFVNRICDINLAKRSYNLFITFGSIFNVLTSIFIYNIFLNKNLNLVNTLQGLAIYMSIAILLTMLIYKKITHTSPEKTLKLKTKLSIFESVKFIFSSNYLMNIAITVIAVGLTINLVEVTWKANLKILFTNEQQMISFMSLVSILLHTSSIIVSFLVSGNLIRKMSWKFNASLAPIIIVSSGTLFFLSSKYRNSFLELATFLKITPLKFVVYLGVVQVIVSKISKYAFYDLTKEIAYIPLDEESKVKGKAAVDSLGSRFGKSGSSYIHLFVLWVANTSSVLNVTSILIPALIIIGILWLISISNISVQLTKKLK